ncbi:MAG: ADP-ribosylglycohydrolase family protein [Clostridiales bacterium]|nr:ADP-ribosylglycohydrolase family protein [Clostridiales bacterium]
MIGNHIDKNHFRGCLVGGATGDTRGYHVHEGCRDLISDNTQMSIFTADGLIWADDRAKRRGIYAYTPCLFYSYQKWYYTQTGNLADKDYKFILGGSVLEHDELFARRGAGETGLNALGNSIKNAYGTLDRPVNNSATCGCVMRVAPIGLYFADDAEMAFRIGRESAALTHGHEAATLSAGYIAALVSYLMQGKELIDAVCAAIALLDGSAGGVAVSAGIERAVALADQKEIKPRAAIEMIGEGFVAPEAVAIATYIALRFGQDFEGAVNTAMDFDGNTDTIAPLCGNLVGSVSGVLEIPAKWVLDLELADLIIQGADMLLDRVREHAADEKVF